MKVVRVLVLLGLTVTLIGAGKRDETQDEGLMEEAQEGDLLPFLVEKRVAAAAVSAATEAARLSYDITKDGIKLIWSVTGMAHKPYVHMINFRLNSNGVWQSGTLQDGDRIRISRKPDPNPSKSVKFTLKSNGAWWKAVTIHTKENTFKYEIVYTQDSVRENHNRVEYREILENFMVLSKAKAFGIHTNMYWIQNSYDMSPKYEWEIYWQRD